MSNDIKTIEIDSNTNKSLLNGGEEQRRVAPRVLKFKKGGNTEDEKPELVSFNNNLSESDTDSDKELEPDTDIEDETEKKEEASIVNSKEDNEDIEDKEDKEDEEDKDEEDEEDEENKEDKEDKEDDEDDEDDEDEDEDEEDDMSYLDSIEENRLENTLEKFFKASDGDNIAEIIKKLNDNIAKLLVAKSI